MINNSGIKTMKLIVVCLVVLVLIMGVFSDSFVLRGCGTVLAVLLLLILLGDKDPVEKRLSEIDDVFMIQIDWGEELPFVLGTYYLPDDMPEDKDLDEYVLEFYEDWKASCDDVDSTGNMDSFEEFLESKGFKPVAFSVIPITFEG